jgi:hypothetical protein
MPSRSTIRGKAVLKNRSYSSTMIFCRPFGSVMPEARSRTLA